MIYNISENGWITHDNHIQKTYNFRSFPDAITFMMRCSFDIEKQNHHPEWKNIYNKLHVTLTTHDAGGITDKDYRLAEMLDKYYAYQHNDVIK